ncbi:MAG: DUF134 domain-containing protein [Verrucomicrobiia bacterium]
MPRPCCLRHVRNLPAAVYFKPRGIPMLELEQVTLTLDEVEALRLADLEALYQEDAAKKMRISRATFARIIEQARRKVADALIHGKALCLEGGSVVLKGMTQMPKGDGTGPAQTGQGMGRGPCGCGQRHSARRGGCCGGKVNSGQVCCSTRTASVRKQKKGK